MKLSVGMSDDPQKLAFLGYCCNCTKGHENAIDLYKRAIDKGYRTTLLYSNLGLSHFRLGRLEPALNALDEAVAIDGNCQLAALTERW